MLILLVLFIASATSVFNTGLRNTGVVLILGYSICLEINPLAATALYITPTEFHPSGYPGITLA